MSIKAMKLLIIEKCVRNENFLLFRELMISFFPLFMTLSFQYMINMTPIVFAGQMGRVELDGISLSLSIIHIFGTSVGYGLGNACDALFSQAYGSENKKRTGFYLQKSLLIALLFPFPIIAFLLNVDHLLLFFRQDPRICEISSVYITTYMPALPFTYCYFITSRYLQNQDKMWPPFVASFLGNSFNIGSQYLMIYQFKFGYQALAVCMVFTSIIMFMFNLLYILISKFYIKTWPGWTITALYDWKQFLRLAWPGIGYATFEQINWEAEIFMSGYMGIVPMAVHSVISQTGVISSAPYVALGITTNVKIGQYTGAKQYKKVKKICLISIVLIVFLATLISLTIFALNEAWPRLFTSDDLIVIQSTALIAYYGIYYLPEAVNGVLAGILRGYCKHSLLMWLAFGNMYLVGLPTAGLLGFLTPLKVTGLWIGNTCGLTCLMIACSVAIIITIRKSSLKVEEYSQSNILSETNEDDEYTPLAFNAEYQDITSNSNYKVGHTRIPSHGTIFPKNIFKRKSSPRKEYSQSMKAVFFNRLAILVFCVILILVGIILRFIVRPDYSRNHFNFTTGPV